MVRVGAGAAYRGQGGVSSLQILSPQRGQDVPPGWGPPPPLPSPPRVEDALVRLTIANPRHAGITETQLRLLAKVESVSEG
jgi:hypothetical protein